MCHSWDNTSQLVVHPCIFQPFPVTLLVVCIPTLFLLSYLYTTGELWYAYA